MGERKASPGAGAVAEILLVEGAGSTGEDQEEYGDTDGREGQDQEPVFDELEGRQGEEEEVERTAEDGVGGRAGGGVWCIPEEC